MTKEPEAVMDPLASSEGEMSDEEIDNILIDSFPASDPPPWTLGTHHRKPGPGFQTSWEDQWRKRSKSSLLILSASSRS